MNPKHGEVWLADLGFAAKYRPVLVLSRDDPDPPRALTINVPITSQDRGSPYEVVLPSLRFLKQSSSVVNAQGISSVPTARMSRILGRLPEDVLEDVKAAVRWALNLDDIEDV